MTEELKNLSFDDPIRVLLVELLRQAREFNVGTITHGWEFKDYDVKVSIKLKSRQEKRSKKSSQCKSPEGS